MAVPLLNGTFRNARENGKKKRGEKRKNDKHPPVSISYIAVSEAKRKEREKEREERKRRKESFHSIYFLIERLTNTLLLVVEIWFTIPLIPNPLCFWFPSSLSLCYVFEEWNWSEKERERKWERKKRHILFKLVRKRNDENRDFLSFFSPLSLFFVSFLLFLTLFSLSLLSFIWSWDGRVGKESLGRGILWHEGDCHRKSDRVSHYFVSTFSWCRKRWRKKEEEREKKEK